MNTIERTEQNKPLGMRQLPYEPKQQGGQAADPVLLRNHLETAEFLARERGGFLPDDQWLLSHGHAALARAIAEHPLKFSHLQRALPASSVAPDAAARPLGPLPARGSRAEEAASGAILGAS